MGDKMQIKITKINGSYQSFNGDIEYHDSYVTITLYDSKMNWVELAIPWLIIEEIEVKP